MSEMTPLGIPTEHQRMVAHVAGKKRSVCERCLIRGEYVGWPCLYEQVRTAETERDALRERVARLESQAAIQAKLIQSVHSDLMMGFTEEALESMERFHDPGEAVVHAHWDEDRRLRTALERLLHADGSEAAKWIAQKRASSNYRVTEMDWMEWVTDIAREALRYPRKD